jgi:hypothetical protein
MRGRSSKQETKEGAELDKLSELKEEETHLSGAYIRSLVKQLTTSGTKDPMNPKHPDCSVDGFLGQNLTKFGEGSIETDQAQQPPQPQQHKKQVRRRLHTSRPYQERLLNMAEARREIVTALKFHRAAMKQQQQQQQQIQEQQQQSPPLQPQSPPHPCFDQEEGGIKSRRNPRVYPSSTANFCHYLDNLSYSHPPFAPYPFSWPAASPLAPPSCADTLNFTLPNQPLGLNLNFRDFCNLETSLYHNRNIPSLYSSSSPSSSSFPNLSVATDHQEVPSAPISQQEVGTPALADAMDSTVAAGGDTGGGLHAAMDDEEMAEIRSIGEQHQMEWNDTMSLATSAWWFKFLKTMELGGPEVKVEADDEYHPFHEVMEFSAGLDANESCLQQYSNDYGSEDYFQDPALPW